MTARADLSGRVFNRWTPLEFAGNGKWRCRCLCGEVRDVYTGILTRGLSKSCGCLKAELAVASAKPPEESKWTKEYQREYMRQYKIKNAERLNALNALRRARYPERVSEEKRRSYLAKREKYIARAKANYNANPEQTISRERAKYSMRKEATPAWANKEAMKELYLESRRLSEQTGKKHHVDHTVPLRYPLVCGLHWEGNMRVITAAENWKKHNRLDETLLN